MSIINWTEQQLLDALRDAIRIEDERLGMTTRELVKALGIGQGKVRDIIRDLIDRGIVRSHSTYTTSISGARMAIPEYFLVKQETASEEKPSKRKKN